MLRNGQIKISSFQIIIGSFLAIILTGALLLMLPLCSAVGTVTPFRRHTFYCHLGRMCDRTCRQRHGDALVPAWAAPDPDPDPGRRSGNDHFGDNGHHAGGQKDQPVSAKCPAGCGLRRPAGRNPAFHAFYSDGYSGSGAPGGAISLPCFPSGVSAVSEYSIFHISLRICFLQCGI